MSENEYLTPKGDKFNKMEQSESDNDFSIDDVGAIDQIGQYAHIFCMYCKPSDQNKRRLQDIDHSDCKERVFTEEDYEHILRNPDSVLNNNGNIDELTQEFELSANLSNNDPTMNVSLNVYGNVCYMLERVDRLLEVLKLCKYKYQIDSLLFGFFEHQKKYLITENVIPFADILPQDYVYNCPKSRSTWKSQEENVYINNAREIVQLRKENAKLKNELETHRTELLLKHTPLPQVLCKMVNEHIDS